MEFKIDKSGWPNYFELNIVPIQVNIQHYQPNQAFLLGGISKEPKYYYQLLSVCWYFIVYFFFLEKKTILLTLFFIHNEFNNQFRKDLWVNWISSHIMLLFGGFSM